MALLAALIALVGLIALRSPAAHAESASDVPDGTYVATLGALNTVANGGTAVTGTVTTTVSGDTFTVNVNAHGLAPNIAHAMHFHTGDSCPTAAADTNHDGVIDVIEGVPTYGPILIPIDSDITSQANGDFPMADADGNINFSTSGSVTALLADLHAADPNPADAVVKLSADQTLDLAMRHVVLHGVAADTTLPATAQSLGDAPAQATLPVACGTDQQVTPPTEQSGTFTATLGALNTAANGGTAVTGTVTTTISGDTFTVHVNAHGLAPNIAHAMHFHTGDSCPTAAADTNHDGVIDVIEGVPTYGPILIPIDSDITSQASGDFPVADASGNIDFTTTGSLSAMLADLHAADPNPADAVVKLGPTEALNLITRHVVLHGVAADTTLPATAQSLGDAPAQATLPVACGQVMAGNGGGNGGGNGQSLTITLQGRWSLIGWVGDTMPVADALDGIANKVSVVWGFDNSTQTWHAYFPAAMNVQGANDLTNVQTGMGYFVDLKDPSTPVQWTIQFASVS